MSLKIDPLEGPGSTRLRRMFWNDVRDTVLTLRKREGRNVTVSEFDGQGTIVQVTRERGQAAPSDCPPPNPCTVDINSLTSPNITEHSIFGKPVCCQPDTDPDGWRADEWSSEFANDCSDDGLSGICTTQMVWDRFSEESFSVLMTLNLLKDDPVLANGWYFAVYIADSSCSYKNLCVFLGTDASVFSSDLNLDLDVPDDVFCPGSPAHINLTFHPC